MSLPTAHVVRQPGNQMTIYAEPTLETALATFKPWQAKPRKSDRYFTLNKKRYRLHWPKER